MSKCDVAIIGAGPYGLSVAAHLRGAGVDFRIFGSPMHTWMTQMPKGMRLKSEGFASSLYDPDSSFTLAHYCRENGLPYADTGLPVPLETFIRYGIAFQNRFVPMLEDKLVVSVDQAQDGFQTVLADGEVVTAKNVVVAAGISHFSYVPPQLAALPDEFISHSSRHSDLDQFKGREVIIVGSGASALDLAALLNQDGVAVRVVARKPVIRFHDPPDPTPPGFYKRLTRPITGIGQGWKIAFCTHLPHGFRLLPRKRRLELVKKILGPAPGWFVKEQVVGRVPFHLGVEIKAADVRNGRISLDLQSADGAHETLTADHVIAATGYKVDLRRLTFLSPGLLANIRSVEQTPVLSSHFQSSVRGLYFVGPATANSFGPLMRFAYGAGFTAPRISRHLARLGSTHRERSGLTVGLQKMEQGEP